MAIKLQQHSVGFNAACCNGMLLAVKYYFTAVVWHWSAKACYTEEGTRHTFCKRRVTLCATHHK